VPLMLIKRSLAGRKAIALPFTDYCEPILSQGVRLRALIDYIIEIGNSSGWKSFELRGGQEFQRKHSFFNKYFIHCLDLERPQNKILASFRSNTKRNIRRAMREGVSIRFEHSMEAMIAFYRLHGITRKRQGLYIQPFKYFRRIHEHIIAPKLGFVALAEYRGRFIAGIKISSMFAPMIWRCGRR